MLASPVYSITSSKLCIIVLFLKDKERIKKFCENIVAPNTILPQAFYVIDCQWFVATQNYLVLQWSALKKNKKYTNEPTNWYYKIEHVLHCYVTT